MFDRGCTVRWDKPHYLECFDCNRSWQFNTLNEAREIIKAHRYTSGCTNERHWKVRSAIIVEEDF